MDHTLPLAQQAARPGPRSNPTSTASDTDPAPDLPAAPSMREVEVQQPLLLALPPALPQTVRNTLPSLAAGAKRSAADAGLEADAVPNGKRVKVSHEDDPDAERSQESHAEEPDPVTGRKRDALDAGLYEDELPARKRARQHEQRIPEVQAQAIVVLREMPAQERMPDQNANAGAPATGDTRPGHLHWKICRNAFSIWFAAFTGDLQTTQAWLEEPGIDVNTLYEHRGTLLHAAARGGSLEIVLALLAMPGIDIDALDSNGSTALDIAMLFQELQIIQALLAAKGFNITGQDFLNAPTALHSAIEQHDVSKVESLLAIPWLALVIKNWNAHGFLSAARSGGDIKIVKLILALPGIAVGPETTHALLSLAAREDNLPLLTLLLGRPDFDANAKNCIGNTALMAAVESGYLPIFQALLAWPGIDLTARDHNGRTALALVTEKTAPCIVEALLAAESCKVDVQAYLERHRELAAAVKAGDLAIVLSLLANLSWININFKLNNKTVLALAAENPQLEVIQALLAVPGIVIGWHEAYALCRLAAAKGHLQLLQFIMDRPDTDANGSNIDSESCLVSAAKNGHLPIVQALLARPGIDVNACDSCGRTALLAATENNHHQIAIVLAAMPGVDVNARPNDRHDFLEYDGYTTLMVAAEKGNLPLVRTLLSMEAINVNLKNKRGYTPLMLAAYRGHLEIVRTLLGMPEIDINVWSNKYPCKNRYPDHYDENANLVSSLHASCIFFSALSLAKVAGRTQIVEALLAVPVSPGFIHRKLHESLGGSSYPVSLKPGKKPAASPEERVGFLRQILHPGSAANLPVSTPPPQREQLDALHASWLEQKCIGLSLGTCIVSDVPFLLQSTIPLPAWCQSSMANAIALGFTAGHYRNAPDPLWQVVQETRAWFAGLAFGAEQSRQEVIGLDAGISYQLHSMRLWNGFLSTVEDLQQLKADPDDSQLDKLTLLGCAARDGDLPMIKLLVGLGANIHLRSPNGDAPILAAARAGQWAACAELLSLGAMPIMVDSKGYPALYYIASAFAHSDTATFALARLIRYLRLKNVRFDIAVPNPLYKPLEENFSPNLSELEDEPEINPTVLVSDILLSNPESWVRFGKVIYGIDDEPLPATATAIPPAPPGQQSTALKMHVHTMFRSADPEAALAAWLDEDLQHLHWKDPDDAQSLLHLAAACQNIGLVRLLLDRGIARTYADHAGRTAAQMLPADYMSSYTPAARSIADVLR